MSEYTLNEKEWVAVLQILQILNNNKKSNIISILCTICFRGRGRGGPAILKSRHKYVLFPFYKITVTFVDCSEVRCMQTHRGIIAGPFSLSIALIQFEKQCSTVVRAVTWKSG